MERKTSGQVHSRLEALESKDGAAVVGQVEVLTVNLRTAAEMLGVSYWTVRDYVLQGLLPALELPALKPREGDERQGNDPRSLRRVVISVNDLRAFVERCRRREAS